MDDIPRNPYGDTDFSRPQGFDEKRDGVDYGYMNDRVIYYSSTIGKDKMCGVLLPAGYDEKQKYPVVYVLHGFGRRPILTGAVMTVILILFMEICSLTVLQSL